MDKGYNTKCLQKEVDHPPGPGIQTATEMTFLGLNQFFFDSVYLDMSYDVLLITLMSRQTVTNLAVMHGSCTMTKY